MANFKRKYPSISVHSTLHGQLEVDWEREYKQEFCCPYCNQGRINTFSRFHHTTCKLRLYCYFCKKGTFLTCQVPRYIFGYRSDVECPNPLCNKIGHDGQKGWIYHVKHRISPCKCHFCGITFKPASTFTSSWAATGVENKLLPFCFDDDRWDLRYFYDNPRDRLLNFQNVQPQWYKIEVKRYLHYLLKSRVFSTDGRVQSKITVFRQIGEILQQHGVQQPTDINRDVILNFLDTCKTISNVFRNQKLSSLKEFLEWLELETSSLVLTRDFLSISRNDPNWLDEVTRTSIEQHLNKIPAPIARHYLVQEYTAARSGDICQIAFDCLVEENGKWYIKFYQHKPERWHKILASRKIRQVIEEQQQWIRQTIGADYSYLFCHFRSIQAHSYPSFSTIKPLPTAPSVDADRNPMVRIIHLLIEKEDIRDANGQKPHFTGKITRSSRLQEIRVKHGIEAAQLFGDHQSSTTTFQHYAPPTREQVAAVDLPFQELLMNLDNKFLPWQSLPESLLKNPKSHELDLEIAPRLVVYGHCALNPKTPCPVNLYPKCYGCSSFLPSTAKLPLYERQYQGEQQRLQEAEQASAELAKEEALATIEAMDKWLPKLRELADE